MLIKLDAPLKTRGKSILRRWVISLSLILAVPPSILAIIELVKKDDDGYQVQASCDYQLFEVPPDFKIMLAALKKIEILNGIFISQIDSAGTSVESLLRLADSSSTERYIQDFQSDFNSEYNLSRVFDDIDKRYNHCLIFSIGNNGKKPLEDVVLDIGTNGIFNCNSEYAVDTAGPFIGKIVIGKIPVGYKLSVKVWFYSLLGFDRYYQNKVRVTHKFGISQLEFSTKVNGLLARITERNGWYMVILLLFYGWVVTIVCTFFISRYFIIRTERND